MVHDPEKRKQPTLGKFIRGIFRIGGRRTAGTLFRSRKVIAAMIRAAGRRKQFREKENLTVPTAIAVSPTNECNLACLGCYSRTHERSSSISYETMKKLLADAAGFGVFFVVITGGEPFIRKDLLALLKERRDMLFLVITNGTVITESTAAELAEAGNIIPVVSLEGGEGHTDLRRGDGVYKSARQAMRFFRERKIIFGFSVVLTKLNIDYIGSDEFADEMVNAGCIVGFYNELIPISDEDLELVPSAGQTRDFTGKLGFQRAVKPMISAYLPYDEYDENGRCMAVGRGAMHINADGFVEPCPFAHYAAENVNTHSFRQILESTFLKALRDHPTVLIHGDIGCSLVSNIETLKEIAAEHGAKPTTGG